MRSAAARGPQPRPPRRRARPSGTQPRPNRRDAHRSRTDRTDRTRPVGPAGRRPAAVDRDSLTEAWGDEILKALPARAKALYSAGRFVAVDEQGAHFALPNAAHRDRCADLTPTVEAALGAHFGAPVTLVLDIDDEAAPPAAGPGRCRRPPVAPAPPRPRTSSSTRRSSRTRRGRRTDEDQASAAQARLLQAFPGASEVRG